MKKPKTFQIREENPDPNFTLGKRLNTTAATEDSHAKVNSLSISVILSKDGKDLLNAKITLLPGTDSWVQNHESIFYYRANTVIDDKIIPSIIYHYSTRKKDVSFVTLLEF